MKITSTANKIANFYYKTFKVVSNNFISKTRFNPIPKCVSIFRSIPWIQKINSRKKSLKALMHFYSPPTVHFLLAFQLFWFFSHTTAISINSYKPKHCLFLHPLRFRFRFYVFLHVYNILCIFIITRFSVWHDFLCACWWEGGEISTENYAIISFLSFKLNLKDIHV